ncbi:MAG: EamA family transporter [Deinococcus-Thermus bacterium]|nr:EamA family transporter [Deinococcota bacterium]
MTASPVFEVPLSSASDPTPSSPESPLARWRVWWADLPANVRGSLWVALAVFLFTLMMMFIKLLGQRLPVVEILFFRQLVMLGFLAPALRRNFPEALKTERPGLHAFRVVGALVAMLAGFEALVHLPLADATAISFAKALFVTVLATFILQEVVGPQRWVATAVGFLGVMIVVQPSAAGVDGYALLALLSAFAVAFVQISLRVLTRTERSITIMAYQAIALALLMAPAALWWWVTPTPLEWLMLIAVGFLSTIGQWCNVAGFRAGEAAAVAPMDYTRILFASAIGFVVFHETPGLATFAGAALIIAATLYTLRHNAVSRRRDAA